jgi:hypothetical protein
MTFVKKQLTPFSSAAADPLFNFSQPFIQQGVISGRYYSAEEVAYGNPKPGYLQATENSDVVTVVASTGIPLRLVFALGLHDANTGGEIGSWRTFTGKSVSNTNLTITASKRLGSMQKSMKMDNQTIQVHGLLNTQVNLQIIVHTLHKKLNQMLQ